MSLQRAVNENFTLEPLFRRHRPRAYTCSVSAKRADIAIVGAGPIGLELAVAAKREGLSCLLFDRGNLGATIAWWPFATKWFSSNERISIAGVPLITPDGGKASREQYLAYLRTVATMYDLRINAYEPVIDIEPAGGGSDGGGLVLFTDKLGKRRRYEAGSVVLAIGGTDDPRRLNVPGEDLPHVHQFLKDPNEYFGQRLLIVGGKNSAVESALRCHHAGAKVLLSYRQDALPEKHIKYWLMPEISSLIRKNCIEGHFGTTVAAIHPDRVTLRRGEETYDVGVDFVLPQIGYTQRTNLLEAAGVELVGDQRRPAFDEQTMLTNVPNLYVAGTAIAGTQSGYRIFLENCHVHVPRIIGSITGNTVTAKELVIDQPES